jgi:hypothetical protein
MSNWVTCNTQENQVFDHDRERQVHEERRSACSQVFDAPEYCDVISLLLDGKSHMHSSMALLQTGSRSNATLMGCDVGSGLAARCAEALFEAAAADPSLTSARLHVSFAEITESAVYDVMASNPQKRGGKHDQREPWIEIDATSDAVGVAAAAQLSWLHINET